MTARHYAWMAIAYVLLIWYGSLVPFHYQSVPWDEALFRFRQACSAPVRVESRSDWAANILLFVPLGYVLMGALTVDRNSRSRLIVSLAVIPACAALSASIEFVQLFFPPRVTSLNDIVAESLGALVGVAGWLAFGQWETRWLRAQWSIMGNRGSLARLLPAYIAFLIFLHVLPLDLTISPVELYHKYREGRIHVIPFMHRPGGIFDLLQHDLTNAAYFFPAGILLVGLPGSWIHGRKSWLCVLGIGLGLAGLVQFFKLFVYTRYSDVTDIFTGSLAVLAGWYLARIVDAATGPKRQSIEMKAWRYATLSWLALLMLINWQPFDFTFEPAWITSRLGNLSLIPFADYYQGEYLHAFDEILSKIALFVPIGVCGAVLLRDSKRAPSQWQLALLAVSLPFLFEFGQLFLSTRYASVSDVLIESFGVWLGFSVARRIGIPSPAPQCYASQRYK